MSASKKDLKNEKLTRAMADYYLSDAHPTIEQTRLKFDVNYHTAMKAINMHVPEAQRKVRRGANHSRSKMGSNNPMYGVTKELNVIQRAEYLAQFDRRANKYVAMHRLVIMDAFGLEKWPDGWEVHHINDDHRDNRLDNLSIVTKRGHQLLHSQKLNGLLKWEREQFGTSLLKEIIATLQRE